MLEKLSAVLKKTTDKIANAVFLDKKLVDDVVRDLQRALLEADVNVSLVMELTKKIKQAALDERVKGIEKKEHIISLLHGELIRILGKKRALVLGKKARILLVGLYGSGKTTTIGKLASYYAKRGRKVCAVGLDVHRPAAFEQLQQVCEKVHVRAFIMPGEKSALAVWKAFEKDIREYDLVLIDSAGRDALDEDLIKELKVLGKTIKPDEVLLVLSGDIGQAAKKQAAAFQEAVGVTGVFISKMDSTAKGGGALSACAEVNAPVVFIGTGEKMNDLEEFDPESFLSRLLGMGDLPALMEKIRSVVGDREIQLAQERLLEGRFSLRDFQEQLGSMESVGSFDTLLSFIPGFGKVKDKISGEVMEEQQKRIMKWKHAIDSMTREEQEHPELLERETKRMQRVAAGAGMSVSDVRALLKQYRMLQEMVKDQTSIEKGGLDQKTLMKLARKFGKRIKL